jgi:multiple sugar transport system substrate-binding protein
MRYRNSSLVLTLLVMCSLLLSACGGTTDAPTAAPAAPSGAATATTAPASNGGDTSAGGVTVHYSLWDSSQQPAYQACADAFHKANPNITVAIQQLGWDDYWSNIQTGMTGGTAPDVFTDHLAKYPEFAAKGQLVDIQSLVARDKVDTGQYLTGLADLWVKDGKRYGLPKDWDTVAIVYNKDMVAKAGVDEASLKDLTWNPKDGGTFFDLIKKLTLDSNGNNATSASFDKTKVVQYGFIPVGSGSGGGQTEWSWLTVPNGWKYNDGPWSTKYYYDDPKFIEALQWYADLNLVHGVAPPLSDITSLHANTLFSSAKGAMTSDGSWNIGLYTGKDAAVKAGFAPLPKGPNGRKSMFNGLADSIWVGSKHQEEAWQWVKFASSAACENIVGATGVVFPAIQSGADASLAKHKADGVDASAFTDEAKDPQGTFLFPITEHASEISSILSPVLDGIMLGQSKAADVMKDANDQINALFK